MNWTAWHGSEVGRAAFALTTAYVRNDWLIWHQVVFVSGHPGTFEAWLSSAF